MLLCAIVVGLIVWMDITVRRMERWDRSASASEPGQALYAAE